MSNERRPHIAVIHRWQDSYAHYESYVDHDEFAVTYITTEVGVPGVPAGAAETVLVEATDDLEQTRAALDGLALRHGKPSRIVALKEDDLLIAAELRAEWGCPGHRAADLIQFRDKYVMARRIAAAGVAAPAFADAPDRAAVAAFAETHGWPVVVKPHLGSSSAGVARLEGPADLDELVITPECPMLVQACDFGTIYTVDGLYTGSELSGWRAGRYINTCLSFRQGTVLGLYDEDDPETLAAIGDFTGRVLAALADGPVVFHLEIFVDRRPGGRTECRFLEVGARVAGAETPFLWREVHGFDLMAEAFRIGLGEQPRPVPPRQPGEEVAGYLLAPAPAHRPCRITESTSMLGRDPGPYAEVLLQPGEILPWADAYYEHVGGRFRFRGGSTGQVQQAIEVTAADFRVRAQPVAQVAVC